MPAKVKATLINCIYPNTLKDLEHLGWSFLCCQRRKTPSSIASNTSSLSSSVSDSVAESPRESPFGDVVEEVAMDG